MSSSFSFPARRPSKNANGRFALSDETSTVVENARLCICCCVSTSGWLFDRLRSADCSGGCVCGRRGPRETLWLRVPELSVRLRSRGTSAIKTDGVLTIPVLVTGRVGRRDDARKEVGECVDPTGDVGDGIESSDSERLNSRNAVGGASATGGVGSAAPVGDGTLPGRSMPAMSFRPTPKKRESFAARMRRTRKCGSEGCMAVGDSGRAKGEATGGDVGAATGAVAEPRMNVVWVAEGLAWKDLRTGEESGL